MSENVLILFIFFILLVVGIVFFTKIQGAKTEQVVSTAVEGKGLQIAQQIASLPEIQCTKDNAREAGQCYDEVALQALSNLQLSGESPAYYQRLFGFSAIVVTKLFPNTKFINGQEQLVIYNNTKEGNPSITATFIPITVCNYLSGSVRDCSFGVLKVEVYN